VSRSALDRNFRSIAAKPQDFSRDEPEIFRLAPENRSLCAGNMPPPHTASTDMICACPVFRARDAATSLSEFRGASNERFMATCYIRKRPQTHETPLCHGIDRLAAEVRRPDFSPGQAAHMPPSSPDVKAFALPPSDARQIPVGRPRARHPRGHRSALAVVARSLPAPLTSQFFRSNAVLFRSKSVFSGPMRTCQPIEINQCPFRDKAERDSVSRCRAP
jgi:hypothetical protein